MFVYDVCERMVLVCTRSKYGSVLYREGSLTKGKSDTKAPLPFKPVTTAIALIVRMSVVKLPWTSGE